MLSLSPLLLLSLLPLASSSIVEYNLDITWVNTRPDGFARPVVGINNAFPCPAVHVSLMLYNAILGLTIVGRRRRSIDCTCQQQAW